MTQKNKILTIGIPTFNRSDVLIKNIDYILSLNILDRIELLVIDNNSDDDTYSLLFSKYKNKFTFIKNETNIGFSKNTIKLFSMCKTKYLLWLSDEDFIIKENINKILDLLDQNNYLFLCPQFYLDDKLYRGKNINTPLKYGDLRSASNHLSGCIFDVEHTRDISNDYDNIFKKYSNLSIHYPQIFMLIKLVSLDISKCIYVNFPISYTKNPMPDTHEGGGFISTDQRLRMHQDLINYYNGIINKKNYKVINKLLKLHKKHILKTIRFALEDENPELSKDFNKVLFLYTLTRPFEILVKIFISPKILFKNLMEIINTK
jgi:glycosyltransferase involved in cell wall biosynthesis